MFHRTKHILLAVIIALCLVSLTSLMLVERTTAGTNSYAGKVFSEPPLPYIEPSAIRMLQNNSEKIPLIVVLRSTTPPSLPPDQVLGQDHLHMRQITVNNLIQKFQSAQVLITPILNQAEVNGDLLDRNDLWIVNGIALTVRPSLFRQLSASSAVESIYLDHYRLYLNPENELHKHITMTKGLESESLWGVEQIRASQVWHTFGLSGTGAVVALMDTGVDFLHPALNGNYRGNLGKGLYSHHTSWFDAINAGVYPYDDRGHGTHVAGSALGSANLGVAPGAKWIGVKVLDTDGYGYDSWILSGFQWLLSPASDPLLAPDIVNASWSSTNSTNTVFEGVIQTLSNAGIMVVFAAGNEGPASGTVGSPASYPGVFAVGASDEDDDVATFSGRGPSPWQELKPYVVAPGVNILSSIPGGVYGYNTGTSMATPHVVGLAAILRGVSRTLPVPVLVNIITSTTQPISTSVPNNESGWGRINAFDAVVRLINPAIIKGSVGDIAGQGIASAAVTAHSLTEPGLRAEVLADANGNYTLALNPGFYDLEASAFGYYTQNKWGIDLTDEPPLNINFTLLPQPVGVINGRVFISNTGQLVTETLTVALAGTPLTTTSSLSGSYRLVPPHGTYTLAVHEIGYRTVEVSVTVQAGETVTQDIFLTPSPRILLVDEGAWYYGSQRSYWSEALDSSRYTYDVLPIKFPPRDTPDAEKLQEYDIVLWSSPHGAPGLVGGAEHLEDYLTAGGSLMISGQDIAYYDAGGTWDISPQTYLHDLIGVSYADEQSMVGVIQGQEPFEGLTISLNGGDGADNQVSPDIIQISNPDFAAIPWVYEDGGSAGCAVDICTQYRALYFGFGFEGIADVVNRQKVMDRSLDWLALEPLTTGLSFKHLNTPVQIGLAGTRLTHTLDLHHIGIAGSPEFITLTAQGSKWPYEIMPYSGIVSPCTSISVDVIVTIPQESKIHVTDWLTLTAISSREQTSTTVVLETKTPAPVLLVDDDRWYPVEDKYIQALEDAGILFDIWDNQDGLGGSPGIRSPQTQTLHLYPMVLWFTGYDWYAPIIDSEMNALLHYMEHGGRLILSSQDFLYYHESDALAENLGIQAVSDGQDIFAVQGVMHPSTGLLNSIKLDYPFPVHTDIVEPAPHAAVVARGSDGQPVAVASKRPETQSPATLFYGFPLEALPLSVRADVLSRAVGWFSPIGQSDWQVSPWTASAGETITYSLILRNDDELTIWASAEHLIPMGQSLRVPSLPADLTYYANSKRITWNGQLAPREVLTYAWEANVLSDPGELVYPTITLSVEDWGLQFDRFASFGGEGLDLSDSVWLSPDNGNLYAGSAVSLSFLLKNSSDYSDTVYASVWMMEGISPITATFPMTNMSHGWYLPWWDGVLEPHGIQTLTIPIYAWALEGPVRVDSLLSDMRGNYWERPFWFSVIPWSFYLPLITK